ncbi:MAG TPA: ATP-binding protein [Puia sp.]|nr:ATP-binding protein [Puia sp.]
MQSSSHFSVLQKELDWLKKIIERRIHTFKTEEIDNGLSEIVAPELEDATSHYASFVTSHKLSESERLLLALAMTPHLNPGLLDGFAENKKLLIASKVFRSHDDISLLPTAQTALYLLGGHDVLIRSAFFHLFETEHLFYKQSVIQLGASAAGASSLDGVLSLTPNFRDLFIYNKIRPPRFSSDFPAHLLTSKYEWEDLVLMPTTMETLEDVKITLKQYDKLLNQWKMEKVMRPGCRVLLYGDSGQGKTLTASLLGKLLNRPVYRVDIAASVSKYVGETNQRLEALFNTAENKDWILFFDEGDAMLGQRNQGGGESSTSHYANQEVAFLLQRIETFNGIIIVATNLRSNIDYAFQRRFDTSAQFKALDAERQHLVWDRFWPKDHIELAPGTDLDLLIKRYSLSPASIVNVIRRIAAHMAEKNERVVSSAMLQRFIQDEEYKFKGAKSFA